MKTVENCFRKIMENSCFTCFDQLKISFDQSSEIGNLLSYSIDSRLLVDRLNVLFWSIEQWSSTNRARQKVWYKFFNFFDQSRDTFNRSKYVNFEFSKCFHTLKAQDYVWWDYTWFLIKNIYFQIYTGRKIQGLDLMASIIGS